MGAVLLEGGPPLVDSQALQYFTETFQGFMTVYVSPPFV